MIRNSTTASIIIKPMDWLNGSKADTSKRDPRQGWQVTTGQLKISTVLYFSASAQPSKKAGQAHRLSWSMEQHSVCQETSSQAQS